MQGFAAYYASLAAVPPAAAAAAPALLAGAPQPAAAAASTVPAMPAAAPAPAVPAGPPQLLQVLMAVAWHPGCWSANFSCSRMVDAFVSGLEKGNTKEWWLR